MTCQICKYDWCWTCGLSQRSIFHLIQGPSEETGFVCEIINSMTTTFQGKYLALRYVAVVLICTIGPPLALGLAIAGAYIASPIFCMGGAINLAQECLRCMRQPSCFIKFLVYFMAVILLWPILFAVAMIVIPFAIVAGSLMVAVFYLVDILLVFLIFYKTCCRSRSVKKSKRDFIE